MSTTNTKEVTDPRGVVHLFESELDNPELDCSAWIKKNKSSEIYEQWLASLADIVESEKLSKIYDEWLVSQKITHTQTDELGETIVSKYTDLV